MERKILVAFIRMLRGYGYNFGKLRPDVYFRARILLIFSQDVYFRVFSMNIYELFTSLFLAVILHTAALSDFNVEKGVRSSLF